MPPQQFKLHQALTWVIVLLISFCSYFLIKIDMKIDKYTDKTNELDKTVSNQELKIGSNTGRIIKLEGNFEAIRNHVNRKGRADVD